MVGPNDVLTASHALYMADEGGEASSVIVTPANWGEAPYGQVKSTSFQYYTDFDPSGSMSLLLGDGRTGSLSGSERDIGLINLSEPLGYQTGWMKLDPSFDSGNVNITGFPAAYGWEMMNDYVSASQSPVDNVIQYSGLQLNPGNSGGPVWYQGDDGLGYVTGVVSTGSWGASVKQVYNDLTSWMSGNDYMIAGAPQPATQPAPQPAPAPVPDPMAAPEQPAPAPAPAPASAPQASLLVIDTASVLSDFNGDGRADLAMRNPGGGSLEIRSMSDAWITGTSASSITGSADWKVISTGDFNGDGSGDVLWQQDGGLVAIWTMRGASVENYGAVAQASGATAIVGVGDFNSDGKSDILWRGSDGAVSTWLMNDHSIAGGGAISGASLDWKVSGIGDFNGDGRSDVLWRNDNGSVAMWLMNGTSSTYTPTVATASLDWQVRGVGDFNADGRTDIIWQQNDGATSIWLMDGDRVIGGWGTVTGSQPGWTLAGVGDFNGDSRSDLLWQDDVGTLKAELMDQLQVVGGGVIGSDNGWLVF